jgi:hypothetical protein
MTGVEILAVEEVVTQYGFNWATVLILGGIIALICTLAVAVFGISPVDWKDWLFCITTGLIVGALVGVLFGCVNQTPVEYETQYKVTISDEVQLNEFNEKYEIIGQDGKIYTVRERE